MTTRPGGPFQSISVQSVAAGIGLVAGLMAGIAAPGSAGAAATDGEVREFIMGLPKTELHVHLEGTLEPEHYIELVKRNGLASKYRSADEVRKRLEYQQDLNTFIEVYEELLSAMVTAEDFEQVTMKYLERVAAQGVVYVEMFFDPQMHTARGIELETVMAGLVRARERGARELGVELYFIACFNRDRPVDSALEHLDSLSTWSEIILGVGLDNPEVSGFAETFAPVFSRAKARGFHLTSHVDVNMPETIVNHWGALDVLEVERLDHGLNTADDAELIAAVKARDIGLTGCVTLLYRDIPGRLDARFGLVRTLLDNGVKVSLNSDDPGLMRSLYVGDLYLLAQREGGFDRDDVLTLVRNGFNTAWLSPAARASYLERLDAFAAAHAVGF